MSKKILNVLLVLVTIVTMFVYIPEKVSAASETVDVTGKTVAQIKTELDSKINTVQTSGGGIVTVTGTKKNPDETLVIAIPTLVTVKWTANYTTEDSISITGTYLVSVRGTNSTTAGDFEVDGGKIINTLEGGFALHIAGSSSPLSVRVMNNSVISTTNSNASGPAVIINDNPGLGKNAKLSVYGGEILSLRGDAIISSGINCNITIEGGTIISNSSSALSIYNDSNSYVYIYGGILEGATRGVTSEMQAIANVTIFGGKVKGTSTALRLGFGMYTYLSGTCEGPMSVTGSGMIVEVDRLDIPKSRHNSEEGLTVVAGSSNGTLKWDTSGLIPKIVYSLNGGTTKEVEWGSCVEDAPDVYTQAIVPIAKVVGAVNYDVYRSLKKNKGFKKVGSTTTESFYNNCLVAGKTYYYKTKATTINAKGKKVVGKYSKVITIKQPALPQVGSDLVLNPRNESLRFNWTGSSNESAIEIWVATSNNKKTKWSKYIMSSNRFDLGRLVNGKKYYYKYRYIHYNGSVSYGPFTPVYTTYTGTGITMINLNQYTTFSISLPSIPGAIEYQIFRSTNKSKGYKKISTQPDPIAMYTEQMMTAGKTYYYKIKPVTLNAKGKKVVGKFGAVIAKSSTPLPIPTATEIKVTAKEKGIKFECEMYKDGMGITMSGIQIWVATTNNKKTKWAKYMVSEDMFTLNNLAANKKYYYKIRYVYYNGNTSYGAFSPVQTVTTK